MRGVGWAATAVFLDISLGGIGLTGEESPGSIGQSVRYRLGGASLRKVQQKAYRRWSYFDTGKGERVR